MLSIEPGEEPGVAWGELAPQLAEQLAQVEVAALNAVQSPVSGQLAVEASTLTTLASQPVDSGAVEVQTQRSLLQARVAAQLPSQLTVGPLGVASSSTLVASADGQSRELVLPGGIESLLASDDLPAWLTAAGLPTEGVDYTLRRTLRYRGDADVLGMALGLSTEVPEGRTATTTTTNLGSGEFLQVTEAPLDLDDEPTLTGVEAEEALDDLVAGYGAASPLELPASPDVTRQRAPLPGSGGWTTELVCGPEQGVRGQPREFKLMPPGTGDYTFHIDWDGDSVFDQSIAVSQPTAISHVFPSTGIFDISVEVEETANPGVPVSSGQHSIVITTYAVLRDTDNPLVFNLYYGGDAPNSPDNPANLSGDDFLGVVFPDPTLDQAYVLGLEELPDGTINTVWWQVIEGVTGGVAFYLQGGDDRLWGVFSTRPIEVHGGVGDDSFFGGSRADVFYGGPGNDAALGLLGADQLHGDEGDDVLVGGYLAVDAAEPVETWGIEETGNLLWGDEGNDLLIGDRGPDVLYGGAGDDQLLGSLPFASAEGVPLHDHDLLIGNEGDDTLMGSWGNDVLQGEAGFDVLYGGVDLVALNLSGNVPENLGNDSLDGGLGDDYLEGSAGNDTLVGSFGEDNLLGQAGDDSLQGGDGADHLFGAAGNDRLDGGRGADQLSGGLGDDVYQFTTLASDVLQTIDDRDGTSPLAGNDTLDFSKLTQGVTVHLGNSELQTLASDPGGPLVRVAWVAVDTLENVIGTRFADQITGDDRANRIEGNGGDDILAGNAGADTYVFSQTEPSELLGTTQILEEEYANDDDLDTLDLTGLQVGVEVGLDTFAPQAVAVREGLTLLTLELLAPQFPLVPEQPPTFPQLEALLGTAHNDRLTGNPRENRLVGGAGHDELAASAGSDTLEGGAGGDLYAIPAGFSGQAQLEELADDPYDDLVDADLVDFGQLGVGVTFSLASSLAGTPQTVSAGTVTLVNPLDVEGIRGTPLADLLTGNERANAFEGLAGDDTLTGGTGSDWYTFGSTEVGLDTIDEVADADEDWLNFAPLATSLTVDLGLTGDQDVYGNSTAHTPTGIHLTTASGIEGVWGGSGNDTLDGNPRANILIGGAGDDLLQGGAGNDTYRYVGRELGDDQLVELAAEGTDLLDLSRFTAAQANSILGVTLSLAETVAQPLDEATSLSLSDHFEAIVGTDRNDLLTGNLLPNTLTGGPGDDTLHGGLGEDVYRFASPAAGELLGHDVLEDDATSPNGLDFREWNRGVNLDLSGTMTQVVSTATIAGQLRHLLTLTLPILSEAFTDILGTPFDDQLGGNGRANLLDSGLGDDRLEGRSGDDTLVGGSGSDQYVFAGEGLGSDRIEEASDEDQDLLDFSDLYWPVTIDLAAVGPQVVAEDETNQPQLTLELAYLGPPATNDTLEDVIGTSGSDEIRGNARANRLEGRAGDDQLFGHGGDDTYVFAGHTLGNDELHEPSGEDNAGSDNLDFAGLDVGLTFDLANLDRQTIVPGLAPEDEPLFSVQLLGGAGFENLRGTAFADILSGNDWANQLDGLGGNDVLTGRASPDTLTGGLGNDRYVFAGHALGSDQVVEAIDQGNDTLDFADHGLGVAVDLASTDGQPQGTGEFDLELTLSHSEGIENAIGTSQNDSFWGNARNNVLTGGAGDDYLEGRGGNDTYRFVGLALGHDRVVEFSEEDVAGVTGEPVFSQIDTLDFRAYEAPLTLDLGTNQPQVLAVDANDDPLLTLTLEYPDDFANYSIENLIGTRFDDDITGNDLNNTLEGGPGDDTLAGGLKNDTYVFAAWPDPENPGQYLSLGHDQIGEGLLWINDGDRDTLDFSRLNGAIAVDLEVTNQQTVAPGLVELTLTDGLFPGATGSHGIEAVIGSPLADTIYGNARPNWLDGRAGDDLLVGRAGNDRYVFDRLGGTLTNLGTDTVTELTGPERDTLDFEEFSTAVQVNLSLASQSTPLATPSVVHTLILTTPEAIENLVGSRRGDRLTGNARANELDGRQGDDTLQGLAGNDTLVGSNDNDTYRFTAADSGTDLIFERASQGIDTIDLSELVAVSPEGQPPVTLGATLDLAETCPQGIDPAFPELFVQFTNSTAAENIIGTARDDRFWGNSRINVIDGREGNDLLVGRENRDLLVGGLGLDTFETRGLPPVVNENTPDDDDLVIGEELNFPNRAAALRDLRNVWVAHWDDDRWGIPAGSPELWGEEADHEERVAILSGSFTQYLGAGFTPTTLVDDGQVDVLNGGPTGNLGPAVAGDRDWVWSLSPTDPNRRNEQFLNQPLLVDLTGPLSGQAGMPLDLVLRAQRSTPGLPFAANAEFTLDWGQGPVTVSGPGAGTTLSHTWSAPGTYQVVVRAAETAYPRLKSWARTFTVTIVPDFIDPHIPCTTSLAGWTFFEHGGSDPARGTARVVAGDIELVEGDSFLVGVEHPLVLAANPETVTLEYRGLVFDTTDSGRINDAFEIAILDQTGQTLLDWFAPNRDAILNETQSLTRVTGRTTTATGNLVTIDVSRLAPSSTVRFLARLVNNDHDLTTSVRFSCGQGTSTVGETKFFVVDGTSSADPLAQAYDYAANGSLVAYPQLAASNQQPRDVAASADGTTRWVLNADGRVVVYDAVGRLLGDGDPQATGNDGFWQASDVVDPQGIVVLGDDLWILDADGDGQVRFYEDAASLRTGTATGTLSFALTGTTASPNPAPPTAPTGLAGDGTKFWITDDATNAIYVYSAEASSLGDFLGVWTLDSANTDPSGLTIEPGTSSTTLWVVDRADKRVYQYDAGRTNLTGQDAADANFALDSRQSSPEGIADPLAPQILLDPIPLRLPADTELVLSGRVTRGDYRITQVRIGATTVEALDAAGRFFTKVRILPGQNQFTFTVVDQGNPTAAPVVSPQSAAVTLVVTGYQLQRGQPDLESLVEGARESFAPVYGRTSFQQSTDLLYAELAITNLASYSLDAPLLVGVRAISDPRVTVYRPDGRTPDGTPYLDFSQLAGSDGRLSPGEPISNPSPGGPTLGPGETSGPNQLVFYNPQRVRFDYELFLLGQANRAPFFTTTPKLEAVAQDGPNPDPTKGYLYDANADDFDPADRGRLRYTLLAGPPPLLAPEPGGPASFDPATGEIRWTPTQDNVGAYQIAIEARDLGGLSAIQSYTLQVVATPNRPPYFTNRPPADAYLGARYAFSMTAEDPDLDAPLTFSLVAGPTNLTIDSTTGQLIDARQATATFDPTLGWAPQEDQLGTHSVELAVADGRGGVGRLNYTLVVHPAQGNRPPVFTTWPETRFQLPIARESTGNVSPRYLDLELSPTLEPFNTSVSISLAQPPHADAWYPDFRTGDIFVSGTGAKVQHFRIINGVLSLINEIQVLTPEEIAHLPRKSNGEVRGNQLGQIEFDHQGRMLIAGWETLGIWRLDPATIQPNLYPGWQGWHTFRRDTFAGVQRIQREPGQADSSTSAILPEWLVVDGHGDVYLTGTSEVFFGIFGWFTLARKLSSYGELLVPSETDLPNESWQAVIHLHNAITVSRNQQRLYISNDSRTELATQGGPYDAANIRTFDAGSMLPSPDSEWLRKDPFTSEDGEPAGVGAVKELPNGDFLAVVYGVGIVRLNSAGQILTKYSARVVRDGVTWDVRKFWDAELDPDGIHVWAMEFEGGESGRPGRPGIFRFVIDGPVDPTTGSVLGTEMAIADFVENPSWPHQAAGSIAIYGEPVQYSPLVNVIASSELAQVQNLDGPMVIAAGGSGTFDLQFEPTSRPESYVLQFVNEHSGAILGTIPVSINGRYRYDSDARDDDGDTLTYRLLAPVPDGAMIAADTGKISWSPPDTGSFHFIVQVSDGRGGIDVQEFDVLVTDPLVDNQAPAIAPLADATLESGELFSRRVTATDPDGDPLFYFLSSIPGDPAPPAGLTIDRTGGQIQWQPDRREITNGVFPITVRAQDHRGAWNERRFTITVTPPGSRTNADNHPPEIVSTAPTNTVYVDAASAYETRLTDAAGRWLRFVYNAQASDSDPDQLTYELPVHPAGMVIDAATGVIAWRPTIEHLGTHQTLLRVSDGRGGVDLEWFSVNVAPANAAPLFTRLPRGRGVLGLPYHGWATALDPEGQAVTYSFASSPPSGASLNSASGLLTWTPTTLIPATFTLRATDAEGAWVQESFTLAVGSGTGVNQPPVFRSQPRKTVALGSAYRYQALAEDPEEDSLSYSLLPGAPEGMTVDALTGMVSWTAPAEELVTVAVALRATDARGAYADQLYSIQILATAANRPPTIVSVPRTTALAPRVSGWPVPQIVETFTYAYDLRASDPDGDPLLWTLIEGPEGMVLGPLDGGLRWIPRVDQQGPHRVEIRVNDLRGGEHRQSYTVTVGSLNQPPRIESVPVVSVFQSTKYQYAVRAIDADDDRLTFSILEPNAALALGLRIGQATGLVEWSTTASTPLAEYPVTVQVSDGRGGVAYQPYTLMVGAHPAEEDPEEPKRLYRRPVFRSTPPDHAVQGQEYRFLVEVFDEDGDPLSLEIDTEPHLDWPPFGPPADVGAQLERVDGTDHWWYTWTSNATGFRNIFTLLRASDAFSHSYLAWIVLVRPTNYIPEITSTPKTDAVVGVEYQYDVQAYDFDDQGFLRFELRDSNIGTAENPIWVPPPEGMTLDATSGRLRWIPTSAYLGPAKVTVVAIDRVGAASEPQTFDLEVRVDDQPPEVAIVTNSDLIPRGSNLWLTVNAQDDVLVASRTLSYGIDENSQTLLPLTTAGKANFATGLPLPEGMASLTYWFIATATDSSGNVGETRREVTVYDPALNLKPVVSLALNPVPPTSEDAVPVITSPVTIRGRVVGEPDVTWRLTLQHGGGGEPIVLASGTGSVGDPAQPTDLDDLAVVDPLELANGPYIIRLRAWTPIGLADEKQSTIVVQSEGKLGSFSFSVTDLTVPIAGIPFNIVRSYDSNRRLDSGDFGYGWTLEGFDLELTTTVPQTPAEVRRNEYEAFRDGDRVMIRLPDGSRHSFRFAPEPAQLVTFKPRFLADAGTTSTLTVSDAVLLRVDSGYGPALYKFDDGRNYNFRDTWSQPGLLTLTTKEGVKYTLDGVSGRLLTITARSGAKLLVEEDGIYTEDGSQGVLFYRAHNDSRRIEWIERIGDPPGVGLSYAYDSQGDLVRVTDRADSQVAYVYGGSAATRHYLEQIYDPTVSDRIGQPGVIPTLRIDYSSGRVAKLTDALGREIPVEYPLAPDGRRRQRVTDPLFNVTETTFDDLGRPVEEIVRQGEGIASHIRRTYHPNPLTDPAPLSPTAVTQVLGVADATPGRPAGDPADLTTRYTYHPQLGQVTSIVDPLDHVSYTTYNEFGQTLTEVDPLGNPIRYVYDAQGNLISLADPSAPANAPNSKQGLTLFANNSLGLPQSVTTYLDGRAIVARMAFNSQGQLLSSTRPPASPGGAPHVTTYTPDANGNVTETRTTVTQPGPGGVPQVVEVVTRATFDAEGRQLTSTDPLGHTTVNRYNAAGQLVETILPDDDDLPGLPATLANNFRTRFEYDPAGRQTAVIYPDADDQFDAQGFTLWTSLANNPREVSVYDAAGRLVRSRDRAGRVTRYEFDAADRQIRVYYPDADDLDAEGNPIEPLLLNNPFSETVYDQAGRAVLSIDPRGFVTEQVYDAAGRVTKTILPDDDDQLDPQRRPLAATRANNPFTVNEYDAAGRQTAMIDANGRRTEYQYDDLGRRVETRLFDGERLSFVKTGYDTLGRRVLETDANALSTRFEYDDLGRLVAVHDNARLVAGAWQADATTRYEYDELGRLVAQRDANDHRTSFEYDLRGSRTAVVRPLGQRQETRYDAEVRVESVIDFNGRKTVHSYDPLTGWLESKEFFLPDGSGDWTADGPAIHFKYFADGQLHTEQVGSQPATVYAYHATGRLKSRTNPDGAAIGYEYDVAGNRTTVTTSVPRAAGPAVVASTASTFDAQNRLATVTAPDGTVSVHRYHPGGNVREIETTPAGSTGLSLVERRHYVGNSDVLDRVENLRLVNGAVDAVLSSYDYTRDVAGRITDVLEHTGRRLRFDYDERGRLEREQAFDDQLLMVDTSYEYDLVGNREVRRDNLSGQLVSYVYNANDQLTSHTAGGTVTSYGYDSAGNQTTLSVDGVLARRYEWDRENRLTGVDTDGDGDFDLIYDYESSGRRISRTVGGQTTRYLTDPGLPHTRVVAEYDTAGVTSYVYGLGLISQTLAPDNADDTISFYLRDAHSGVRQLAGVQALAGGGVTLAVTDTYTFDAFGNLLASTGTTPNRHLFQSELVDPTTGQYELGVRPTYDATTARFLSTDPFDGILTTPHTLHRYGYVHNDPVNFVDPSGMFEGLGGAMLSGAIQGSLVSMAMSAPFRVYDAATQLAAGAELGSVLLDSTLDLLWDGFVGGLFGGAGAGLAKGFSILSRIGPVGRTVEQVRALRPVGSVWNLHPFARGDKIHNLVLGRLPNLPHWFPGIDDFAGGVATSIKSLDLTAQSYRRSADFVRQLWRYADDLADYSGGSIGGVAVDQAKIQARNLVVVFERGALSVDQALGLRTFMATAKSTWPHIRIVVEFVS